MTFHLVTCIQKQSTLIQLIQAVIYSDAEWVNRKAHCTNCIQLEDIFSQESLLENETLNCSITGIVNSTCGMAGSIQAFEVLKILIGLPSVCWMEVS